MGKQIDRKTHILNATDQSVGRLATEVATLLIGKHKPSYVPHVDGGDIVVVENVDKLTFTGQKLKQKIYYHHSGYPGGLKQKKMGEYFHENPSYVLHRAVINMLPKNKLRKSRIKRLRFKK
ncbi:50S ribosomal protein L13 [Patescibacteria group bacterium AH-259-L05]|nr:50S ribosomal protein L13 [Patescibacteria group bacterium AH-259-L05]